jgi:serine/threonine protein kinase
VNLHNAKEIRYREPATLLDYRLVQPTSSGTRWICYDGEDTDGNPWTVRRVDKELCCEFYRGLAIERGVPEEEWDEYALRHYNEYHLQMARAFERTKGLHHNHILKMRGCDYDPVTDQLVIVTERMPRGNFFVAAQSLKPLKALFLYAQALEGLAYMHGEGLLHLNIKPSSFTVPIDSMNPVTKLIDYGYAVPKGRGGADYIGALNYAAPEVILDRTDRIDERADLFSVGVIMYQVHGVGLPFARTFEKHHREFPDAIELEMRGQKVPPLYHLLTDSQDALKLEPGESHRRFLHMIATEECTSQPPLHLYGDLSPEFDEMVMGLLHHNPGKRRFRTARELLDYIYKTWPKESREPIDIHDYHDADPFVEIEADDLYHEHYYPFR